MATDTRGAHLERTLALLVGPGVGVGVGVGREEGHRNAETSPLETRALQGSESPDEAFAGVPQALQVGRGSVPNIPQDKNKTLRHNNE